jgi:predicted MFS family arabinose efflux permease
MSWVFLIGLPLGGVLASRLRVPTAWACGAFAVSAAAAVVLMVGDAPVPALVVHGLAFALAVPVISAQPLQVLRPATRGAGLALYFVWYYVGAAAMPPIAGMLKDGHGPVMPILFAIALIGVTIAFMAWFAIERTRRPAG